MLKKRDGTVIFHYTKETSRKTESAEHSIPKDPMTENATVLKKIFYSKLFIVFCFILIIIDLLYPVTFTPDSGHYFSYLKILNGQNSFHTWDPVRGLVFPLFLKVVTDFFGKTTNSLLIVLIFFHILFFAIAAFLVLAPFKSLSCNQKNWLIVFVFSFIAVDPLIIGYYHTALTEFMASSMAVLSCSLAFIFYKTLDNKKTMVAMFGTFSLLVPIAWHLKQPYIGISYFPLVLASFLVIINKGIKKEAKVRVIVGNVGVILSLGMSIFIWNQILWRYTSSNDPARYSERKIASYIGKMQDQNLGLLNQSPMRFVKNYVKNYLALSNIYLYALDDSVPYTNEIIIEKKLSLTRAFENRLIAYRIYELDSISNIFYMPENYAASIRSFETFNSPPLWLNMVLSLLTIKSTFLFSLFYLLLPFTFCIVLLMAARYPDNMAVVIIFLCSGTSFLNVLAHSFINNPIDRYIFWGYPLLLISFLIILIPLFRNVNLKNLRLQKLVSHP